MYPYRSRSRVLPIIATLLTALAYLALAGVAQAERSDPPTVSPGTKVSVLLKGSRHRPDETINVIVTLNGSRSTLLNAFLKQNGVRLRRDFKNLYSFSLSLSYSRVAELASFPEISCISSNEVCTLWDTFRARAGQSWTSRCICGRPGRD